MLYYRVIGHYDDDSQKELRNVLRNAPLPIQPQPLVLLETTTPLDDVFLNLTGVECCLTGVTYDGTDVIANVDGEAVHAIRGAFCTMHPIVEARSPYMCLVTNMSRRRRYVAFTNSLADIWARRPQILRLSSLLVEAIDL